MSGPLTKRFTFADLRAARVSGAKVPMLTCYDFTTARLMQQAGVPMLLVGDSAANVILGHDSTLPVPLDFMIEITAAVRRGAPLALVMGDMPFGSFASAAPGHWIENVLRMVKLSGCDCVKLEVAEGHAPLIKALADAGVAVVAHLGLRPQSVGLLGGAYRFQGRTASEANALVDVALLMQHSGASAILLEAVPPEVSQRIVERTGVPIIGCGAGPACHGHVIVTHDGLGLTERCPRFVPDLTDLSSPMKQAFEKYVKEIEIGAYPAPEHQYVMPAEEKAKFGAEGNNVGLETKLK
jgi:3-methyl-2-oxobutanoate hydroxymethyltransferase